ncbi:hypothetical protein V6N13_106222 [Hibiscus sabdariffa]
MESTLCQLVLGFRFVDLALGRKHQFEFKRIDCDEAHKRRQRRGGEQQDGKQQAREQGKQPIGEQKDGKQQVREHEKQLIGEQKVSKQQAEKQQFGDQHLKGEQQVVSVFVENIPKAMHWKGLWHAFARHADVIHSFITRKLSRGGKRFGFVRMKTRTDALRVIERLNGFMLYGFRLTVKLAKPIKGIYRKKSYKIKGLNNLKYGMLGRAIEVGESGNQNRVTPKCIYGHVEDEEL